MSTELNQNTQGVETPQTPQTPRQLRKLVKIAIKKEVRPTKIIKVPKRVYNTIRSFVESSLKKEYVWNTGYDIGDKVVFEKPEKWLLIVKKEVEVREGENVAVAVLKINGRTVDVVAEYVIDYEYVFKGVVRVNNETIDDFDQIVAEEEVPFARPIFGYEIREMFEQFFQVEYYI